jgi:hypothetical protein
MPCFIDWWQEQDFKVAQGDGLFTHLRLTDKLNSNSFYNQTKIKVHEV